MSICSKWVIPLLFSLLLVVALASLSLGASGYTILDFVNGRAPKVIIELRLTRLLAAVSAGIVLASSGILLQYALRNPLADPYLLGVSPAAFLAVSVYALLAPTLSTFYTLITPVAIAGGLAGLLLTLIISRLGETSHSVILAGIAVATSLSGLSFAIDYIASTKFGWSPSHALFGGFAGVPPAHVYILAFIAAASCITALVLAAHVESLLYGDDASMLSGVEPRRARIAALVAAGVTVAAITGYTGVIGFVGLIAPNAARRVLQCVEARLVAVTSMLLGAAITTSADLAARLIGNVAGLGEIPAGALIAIFGGFTLAMLVARSG
ncbi:transport system permease protein [Pyrolobus fumarii 1A]|uniref:Transport system permease protein n=1 Tax=Pyrolobus fumarii (strain DSM 11204 / 1A) TaxID=694429 RepID=G0ED10_PYRF1|nr:iron ABC transporter permease [Pyrolobus fumarii]AEM38569.1 transport system permease protein [Pyrolobus fumarii 1A]